MLQLPETDAPHALPRWAPRSQAQIAAGDAAVLAAFKQLEFGLADLVQMTSIAGTLIESYGKEAIAVGKLPWTAAQAMHELKKTGDQLMFMTYEIEQKAIALNDEWQAAAAAGDHTFNEPEEQDSDDGEAESISAITADRDRWKRLALAHEKELDTLRPAAR